MVSTRWNGVGELGVGELRWGWVEGAGMRKSGRGGVVVNILFCLIIISGMDEFLVRLQDTLHWKDLMRAACKANQLNTALAGELTVLKLKILNQRFKKTYAIQGDKIANQWIQNQLKAYNWILIALSALENLPIANFALPQWNALSAIFPHKSHTFLKFEARRFLCEKKTNNKRWTPSEKALLSEIMREILESEKEEEKQVQWNEVARRLFERSGESSFRTAKHCRERWLNELDPSKNREAWTLEQDRILLDRVEEMGKKWAELAEVLKRTEHAVKNRFNSLLVKGKKTYPTLRKEQALMDKIKSDLREVIRSEMGRLAGKVEEKQKQGEMVGFPTGQHMEEGAGEAQKQKEQEVENDEIQPLEGMQSLQHIVKEDNEAKSAKTDYQRIISPLSFWAYSPKNITPNGFMNSPSPLGIYMRWGFSQCVNEFTHSMNNFEKKEE